MALRLNSPRVAMREMHADGKSDKAHAPHRLHGRRGVSIGLDHEPERCHGRKPNKLKHRPYGGCAEQLDEEWRVCAHRLSA